MKFPEIEKILVFFPSSAPRAHIYNFRILNFIRKFYAWSNTKKKYFLFTSQSRDMTNFVKCHEISRILWFFLRLTIYVYTNIILECLILDGYFMLYQTIFFFSQVAQSKEIQLLGKTYEIFAFFGRFPPQRSEELDVCFQTRIFT